MNKFININCIQENIPTRELSFSAFFYKNCFDIDREERNQVHIGYTLEVKLFKQINQLCQKMRNL
jgi:hypothetical protein